MRLAEECGEDEFLDDLRDMWDEVEASNPDVVYPRMKNEDGDLDYKSPMLNGAHTDLTNVGEPIGSC